MPISPPDRRCHVSTFAVGERFRYTARGPVCRRVGPPDGPIRVVIDGGRGELHPPADLFVIPVDPPTGARIPDGPGLTGSVPAPGEEGGRP